MAESLIPEVIPGLVQIKYTGKSDEKSGLKAGMMKTVFPIDAKELMVQGDWELVDNGAVEAARLNANPLRTAQNLDVVVAEVTGIAGQVHVASSEKEAAELIKAADHGGKDVAANAAPAAPAPKAVDAKAPGNPTGASAAEKK